MVRRHWFKAIVTFIGTVGLIAGMLDVVGASAAVHNKSAKGKPIIIGAVIDETSTMKPFDQPAVEAAQVWAKKVNATGGVLGRPIKFDVFNDKLTPTLTRSDAEKAISDGANALWVTCDVTYATPAIEVGLAHHTLVVAPCTSTNEMGPSRFGTAGKLAFTFGNDPTSTGAVLARLFIQKGWKTATVVTDHLLTYFVDVCQDFTTAFQKMGGKVVTQLSYTTGDHTVTQVGKKAAASSAAGTVLCTTTTPTLPAFVTSVRTLGNTKPIVGPWSIDGGFWEPSSTTVSNNLWWSTYSSVFGDDPSSQVRSLYAEMKSLGETPTTGGYVLGVSALQGLITAIDRTHGTLSGAKLADQIVKFKNVSTLSGPVSFSAKLHSVAGRPSLIIEDSRGKPHYVETLSPGKYAAGVP